MDFINKFKYDAPAFADVIDLLNVKTFDSEDVERFDALSDDEKRAVLAIAEECADIEDTISGVMDMFEDGRVVAYTWAECWGEDHLKPIAEDCAENWGVLSEIPERLRYYFDVEKWFADVQLGAPGHGRAAPVVGSSGGAKTVKIPPERGERELSYQPFPFLLPFPSLPNARFHNV